MEENKVLPDLSTEDFIIRIRPMLDDQNVWTGQVDINIVTLPNNPLDDEDYGHLVHFCKMVCSSVPIMEEVVEFRNMLNNYAVAHEEVIDFDESCNVQKTYDGNVIHIKFDTDTEGNA